MSNSIVDRNLLFGLLALQNGIITREALVAAFRVWLLDNSRVDELRLASPEVKLEVNIP